MALDHNLAIECFRRDGWKCRHCRNRNGLHPHHVIYKSKGGQDVLNNLLTLCFICHEAIHGRKLLLDILVVLKYDLIVKFTRKDGWKP